MLNIFYNNGHNNFTNVNKARPETWENGNERKFTNTRMVTGIKTEENLHNSFLQLITKNKEWYGESASEECNEKCS